MSSVGEAIDKAQIKVGGKAARLMRFTCTVSTPGAEVNVGDGTTTPGTPTTQTDVPCDYEPLSSYEKITGGAVGAGADYALEFPVVWEGEELIVPANATVAVDDTALIAGKTFDVVGPLPSKSVWKQRVSATLRV